MAGSLGVPGGHGQGGAGRCSSRSRASRSPCRRPTRATSWATSTARRGRVQGTEQADDGDQCVTALVPTSEICPLRRRPALAHRRPGPVQRRPRPLRRRSRAHRRQDRQGERRLSARSEALGAPSWSTVRPRPTSFSQVSASDSGITRIEATDVMKFVSPIHRGSTCRWRWRGMPAPPARPRLAPMFRPVGAVGAARWRRRARRAASHRLALSSGVRPASSARCRPASRAGGRSRRDKAFSTATDRSSRQTMDCLVSGRPARG